MSSSSSKGKKLSVSLTIDEAVALMVNMDFIPEGETVLSMTEAFLEEASVEFENAYGADKYQLKIFENRMRACEARHNLAVLLRASLMEDAVYNEDTVIECTNESTDEHPLITLESLSDWAFDRFGIGIHNNLHGPLAAKLTNAEKSHSWQDVTIKIYKDYRLGYFVGDKNFKQSSFRDIDLMGERKLIPNELGGILIGLSKNTKFPTGKTIKAKDITAISKLKKILIKLTGLNGEPFYRPNEADGYRPRFKLIHDMKNADERLEKQAQHESYDDRNDYSFKEEDDEAGDFLKNHNIS